MYRTGTLFILKYEEDVAISKCIGLAGEGAGGGSKELGKLLVVGVGGS